MATTVIHNTARFTVGVAVAGMVLGQTGTAFRQRGQHHRRGPHAGRYDTTGVTDDDGGLTTLTSDAVQATSNADTTGTFTIAADQHSGSISTDLDNTAFGQPVHITGTWRCS